MQADECYLITAVCPCIKCVECDKVRVEMEIYIMALYIFKISNKGESKRDNSPQNENSVII